MTADSLPSRIAEALEVEPKPAADAQFISDLFLAYAHLCSGAEGQPAFRLLRTELLRDRDGHRLSNRRIRLIDIARVYRVMLSLLLRRAAVVPAVSSNFHCSAGTTICVDCAAR